MRPTVFGIPAPWSGDPGSGQGTRPHPHLYRIWWAAYRAVRVARHWVGLHDRNPWGDVRRCNWCGFVWGRR